MYNNTTSNSDNITHKATTAFGNMLSMNNVNDNLTDRKSPSIICLPHIKQKVTSSKRETNVKDVKQERVFKIEDVILHSSSNDFSD